MGGIRIARGRALALALALCGCSDGGQSSDDGVPRTDRHRPPDDGGSPDAETPERHEHTIVIEAALDSDLVYGCGAGFTETQLATDPKQAILAAPYLCRGNTGSWTCECDGEPALTGAFGCEAALYEACGVAADATDGSGEPATAPSACHSNRLNLEGDCTRRADGDFACACGHPLEEPRPPIVVEQQGEPTPASCELALFRACGTSCGDEYGACEPKDDTIGAYTCACSTHGLSRDAVSLGCEIALQYTCSPLSYSDDACNGYGGYCVTPDLDEQTTMHCACADGTEQDVAHTPYWADPRPYSCRETLEATCGLGSPPKDALCLGDNNGYRARCTRGPRSDGPFSCECYLDGDPAANVQTMSVASDSCDEALLESFCTSLAELPEGAAEAACDYYDACEPPMAGFERGACIESVSDACAACVLVERARIPAGMGGCPSQPVECDSACDTLVPREVGVAACEQLLEEDDELTPEASCLCDACYPAFGNCLRDAGCRTIFDCAVAQGCQGDACAQDPVCGAVISRFIGTPSLGTAMALGRCPSQDACTQ